MNLHDFDTLTGAWPREDGFAYVSDASGRPQPWVRTWAGDYRLLPIDGAVLRLAWRPDGSRLLVQTDLTGTEHYRLAEIDPDTGAVDWLADAPNVRHEIGVPYGSASEPYSPDGTLLAFSSNARDSSCFDVYVRDLATGESRLVLEADDRYLPVCFSPDSRQLLVIKLHQNTEQDLFACDLTSGEIRHLTPHDGPAKYLPGGWTEDGIYLCTTEGRSFLGAALLVPGKPVQWLDTPDADVESITAGPKIVWAITEDQRTILRMLDPETHEVTDLDGLSPGICAEEFGFDGYVPRFAGDRLLLQVGNADRPAELWLVDPSTAETRRLTNCGDRLPPGAVSPETVWFTSSDGLEVSGLLYRPLRQTGPVPAVLHIHGGPEARALPVYDPMIQELLRRGIAVLAPNMRGSNGRGLAYQRLIYRDWGGGDLADFGAAAAFLRGLDWVDGSRLGVYGASYGGFAALSCVSRLPHLWRAGVAVCGPSDLVLDVQSMPPTWRRRAAGWIGDPDDPADAARLAARSPLNHAANIRAPLLLVHGVDDTRVSIEGTEQLHDRLRDLGRTVKLIRVSGGHSPTDRESWADADADMLDWFSTHL
ncbi:Dipeptidyl aminopeptidase/acylaminoacyl peptidase [Amycolatopsis xylanica]|uniref:Dipeptidyl aminopeptidase/acylaminoacyl peptidase n=1 Tax=Amycolatopsis xylanica TaxID=589385 RepID=A0A1H3DCY3_9PSEU|nr:S9 family peptidase [Amycolatopsis xylanica]SDX64008.1 Dipeptidyl aminopeptidase/acylaminoacyl peptidase [Amycolatopsis xylanica]